MLIIPLAELLMKIFKTWDMQRAKYWASVALVAAVVLFVLIIGIVVSKCGRGKPAVIDQESINKINSAAATERKAELQKQVEQNADVVRTADNRMAIAETNTVERNQRIAETVAKADAAVIEAKQQGRDITGPELECLLTKVCE